MNQQPFNPYPPQKREFDYHRIPGADEAYRKGHDRISWKTDPVHSMTPGTIREYRSKCCGSPMLGSECQFCRRLATPVLTKVNP